MGITSCQRLSSTAIINESMSTSSHESRPCLPSSLRIPHVHCHAAQPERTTPPLHPAASMAKPSQPEAIEALPKDVIISPLEGTLLRDHSFFPYYMLVALEAGSPLRALFLLLLTPIIWMSSICISHAFSIQLQLFVATAGLQLSEVHAVAMAVLPKFFLDDLEPAAYRAFLNASAKCTSCVVTSHPKLFLEYFLRTHLHVDVLLASELQVTKSGICTGFLVPSQSMIGEDKKMQEVELLRRGAGMRTFYGLCVKGQQHGFFSQCQKTIDVHQSKNGEKVPRKEYLTPLVFHDGRLVIRPTPLASLMIVLWSPIGFTLAILRMITGLTLPQELAYPIVSLLGLRLRVGGAPPLHLQLEEDQQKGVMYVCMHRTLADPTFVTMALRRKVRALTFSVSKLSEFLTPIRTTRLTRNREVDANIIKGLLEREDLCVCPEGTTCREPFLLRFSPLFAELADWIVPVAVDVKMSMFHGTSARGYKFMDGFFLTMNPTPKCEVTFLDPICTRDLRKSGKSAIEIANSVQKQLAAVLGYESTNYKRKDKYFFLAGHDGNLQ